MSAGQQQPRSRELSNPGRCQSRLHIHTQILNAPIGFSYRFCVCVPLQDPFPPCPDSFPGPIFLRLITTFPGIEARGRFLCSGVMPWGVVSHCSPLSHQTAGGREGEGAMEGRQSLKSKTPALPLVCPLSGPLKDPNHTNEGVPELPRGWGVGGLAFGQTNMHLLPIPVISPSREAAETRWVQVAVPFTGHLCLLSAQETPSQPGGSVSCRRLPFFSTHYIVIIMSLHQHPIHQTAILVIGAVDGHLAAPGRAGCRSLKPNNIAGTELGGKCPRLPRSTQRWATGGCEGLRVPGTNVPPSPRCR